MSIEKYIRIQVTGPFAELDYIVTEKKAATELRKIKALAKTFVQPVKQQAKESYKKRVWSRKTGWYYKGVQFDFVAADHGISKTVIQISSING